MSKASQGLIIATVMIAAAAGVFWGVSADLLHKDASMRLLLVINALLVAYYGNDIPKVLLRTASARGGRRFAGWVFVLAGLAAAVLWAFAPLDFATPAAMSILAGAIALTFAFCRYRQAKAATSE